MQYVELTSEQFTKKFKQQYYAGKLSHPLSGLVETLVDKCVEDSIGVGYNMYLYCLDVYNGVRTGEKAKYNVEIETKRGKKKNITDKSTCIKLKSKYKTYTEFSKAFEDSLLVFDYFCKHVKDFETTTTLSQIEKLLADPSSIVDFAIHSEISLSATLLGAKIYIDEIWEYIPSELNLS